MKVSYIRDSSDGVWWCKTHHRFATHIRRREEDNGNLIDTIRHCDPSLAGITMPCDCFFLKPEKPMNTIQKLTKNCSREDCKIVIGRQAMTLIGWFPTYDKNGNVQGKDPNTTTSEYSCSTCGKKWRVRSGGPMDEETITEY